MARFEVYISDEGIAEVDGEPLVPAPGQSVHEAVLDQLQRYAAERDAVVEATVNDPGTGHFVLEVAPDGSSRLLTDEPEESEEPVESVESEEPVESGESGASAEPEAAPTPTPFGATADTAVATAVARATAAARAAAQAPAAHPPAPQASPAPADLPAELAGRVSRINALAKGGRLDEAYALATELREGLTDEAGAEDPYAVEARAVEAYLAYLRGDHREATVLALAVARIRCRAGDLRAPEEVARAAAAWQWIDDERAAVAHGYELLHMWDRLDHGGLLPPAHAELAGQVRRRVDALEAYV
jgi:hypothetical protein